MNNPIIQTDIAEILGQINQKLDCSREDVTDLKVGQAKIEGKIEALDTKVEQLDKRIGNQEFTNQGVLIGLVVVILGGAAKLFGFMGVNMSSGRGSLTQHSDSQCQYAKTLAYNSSKTALNAFTVMLAAELKDTAIKVNSADPDWCRTDMGTKAATYSVEEGADTPVWLATLNADGFTGGFFNSRQLIPW